MGCCYSIFCKDDNSSQNGEPNERTHLLVDPVSNIANIPTTNSEDILSNNYNTLPKKTDEQTALNRILQETATNVIDVAALDSQNLQQHECLERMKVYNIKVQQILGNFKPKITQIINSRKTGILQDIPNPEKVLAESNIGADERDLLSLIAAASIAVNDIKVDHKEDLVVPFGLNC